MNSSRWNILLFHLADVPFGVVVAQIMAITYPVEADAGVEVIQLPERLAFQDRKVTYLAPRIVWVKERDVGVMIDNPERIVSIDPAEIQFLADYTRSRRFPQAYFGVMLTPEGEPVLLLDLQGISVTETETETLDLLV
ncbi:MAG: hypothetical protein HQM06_01520 [Magnetococcales bacterium]|nr:hypothetical protein [Magnetococcales bacterium]